MHQGLSIAKTGVNFQNDSLTVVSNNLANVNTTGFKRSRAVAEELMYQTKTQPGGLSTANTEHSSGVMLGTGVKMLSTQKIHTQGTLTQTGNSLDLAIEGRGFFQLTMPDGSTAYSRSGEFQLDSSGNMVTSQGYSLATPITIPAGAKSITIGKDGVVSVLAAGSSTPSTVGTMQLADFVNPAGLQPMGGGFYTETSSSGSATVGNPNASGMGSLAQGALESSNVNVVEELVRLIETQRAMETNGKAISAADETLRYLNNNL